MGCFMARPADFAGQRADDLCIAADRLLIAMEDGGKLLSGYPQSLIRAKQQIDRALVIHQARINEEDRQWRAA